MNDVSRLEEMSSSPFRPETPRKSLAVDAIMRVVEGRRPQLKTPHLHGGSNREKVLYEYDSADLLSGVADTPLPIGALAGKDVIDVGCGWGGKTIFYAERSGLKSIYGFDLPGTFEPAAPEEFAREKGLDNCTFGTGYAEEIPAADESYDVAINEDVLEHVADPEKTLAECVRVLRPGGVLALKFPSIRMMAAHHLDRVLTYPGLHYVVPLRTWAAGLNHRLLQPDRKLTYEPFDEVVTTRYHRAIPRNLNGMDFRAFKRTIEAIGLETLELHIGRSPMGTETPRQRATGAVYDVLWKIPRLREFLGRTILYVGRKPAR